MTSLAVSAMVSVFNHTPCMRTSAIISFLAQFPASLETLSSQLSSITASVSVFLFTVTLYLPGSGHVISFVMVSTPCLYSYSAAPWYDLQPGLEESIRNSCLKTVRFEPEFHCIRQYHEPMNP